MTDIRAARIRHVGGESPQVLGKIDVAETAGGVQHLVNQRHRMDTLLASPQRRSEKRVPGLVQLHAQQAADNLKIVFDPVMNLLQQNIFLPARCLKSLLCQRPRLCGFLFPQSPGYGLGQTVQAMFQNEIDRAALESFNGQFLPE